MPLSIRPAGPEDAGTLTEISFAAKRGWGYPESYFEIWRTELTITPAYIESNIVYVAEQAGAVEGTGECEVLGYYSIVENPADRQVGKVFVSQGFWLQHIFIRPGHWRRGIGRRLIEHAREEGRRRSIESLRIFADPFAKGFYDRLGAEYLGESPSNIEGRMIPMFALAV